MTETGTPAVNDEGEMTEIGGVVNVVELVVPPDATIGMPVDDKDASGDDEGLSADDRSGRLVGDRVSSDTVYSVGTEM